MALGPAETPLSPFGVTLDCAVVLPDGAAAVALARSVEASGYRADIAFDAESGAWICFCKRRGGSAPVSIANVERELGRAAAAVGGRVAGTRRI